MSKTGSVADSTGALAQAMGARKRGQTDRVQHGKGDGPGFPDYVREFESVTREALVARKLDREAGHLADENEEARHPLSRATRRGPVQAHLAEAAHRAVLMLDRADQPDDAPPLAAEIAELSTEPELRQKPETPDRGAEAGARDLPRVRERTHPELALPRASARPIHTEEPASQRLATEPAAMRSAQAREHHDLDRLRQAQRAGSESRGMDVETRPQVVSGRSNQPRLAPAGDVSVKVLGQETHLAPAVPRPSPMAQIATVIAADSLGSTTEDTQFWRDVRSESSPRHGMATPVRILTIQLQPAELGTVNIQLKLEANVLEVRLEAQKAATAELIRRDQGALASLLRSAGYDVEGMTVHVAEPDRSIAANLQPQPQSAPQAQSGWSLADGKSGSANSQSGRGEGAAIEKADPGAEQHEAGAPQPRGYYV